MAEALSNQQIQKLADKFSDIFTDEKRELGDRLLLEYEYDYDQEFSEFLDSEGFPTPQANYMNVMHYAEIESNIDFEQWAEIASEDEDINGQDDFESYLNDDDNFFYTIMNNMDSATVNFYIEEELQEWIESHPTEAYLSEEMEKFYDPTEFEEVIRQNNDEVVHDKVKEALSEEGFPEDTNPDDVDFNVYDVQLNKTFDDFAVEFIDDVNQSYDSVKDYLETQFYIDVISNESNYDFEVEITSDPEDFDE